MFWTGDQGYIDEDGEQLPRDSIMSRSIDASGKLVRKLITPHVVAAIREHYACPSLDGAELENQGGDGTVLSHWEKRVLRGDIMVGSIDGYFDGYMGQMQVISKVTMALLQDSGWCASSHVCSSQYVFCFEII